MFDVRQRLKDVGNMLKSVIPKIYTSGAWRVFKFPTGDMIAIRDRMAIAPTLTASTGGAYGVLTNVKLPDGFIAAPNIFVMAQMTGNQMVSLNTGHVTAADFDLVVARHFASDMSGAGAVIVAIGRCKTLSDYIGGVLERLRFCVLGGVCHV